MEQYGNQSTYNLETVLKQNINNADFYKNDCLKLKSWSEVIDQIFYQVRASWHSLTVTPAQQPWGAC